MSALCGLPRAAALCEGAEVLYGLIARVYGLTVPPWAAVTADVKHAYYREVEQLVARLHPLPNQAPLFDLVVAVARAEAAKVVGRITPAAPWGDLLIDGRD